MATDFQSLDTAVKADAYLGEVRADEAKFADEDLSDEVALRIVVSDANIAEQFVQSKTLATEWNKADDLNRAYVTPRTWPNSQVNRANIPMPAIMEAIETLLPQAHMAFFSDPQPFLVEPKGKTTANCARSMGKIASWAAKECGFEEEIRKMLKSCFLYGTGIGKWGWAIGEKEEKTYARNAAGSIVSQSKMHECAAPTFEQIDIRSVLVDPRCGSQDIRGAAYVIHQTFINAEELDGLRDAGYKNVPTRDELKTILAGHAETTKDMTRPLKQYTWRENQKELPQNPASIDPLKQPLEILEYWTHDRVITVLQGCIVLRNEPNEFKESPFVSCAFIDVLNSFWGFGVAKLLEGEQRFQTAVVNAWIDSLNLKLNPTFLRKKGIGTQSQNVTVGPGRVINEEELVPLQMESVSQEAMEALNSSENRASRRVGANYGPEMPTQAMRTAEGVNAFTNGVQVRLQYFIEVFADMVYIPVVEAFVNLCKDNLKHEEINAILTDEEGQEYEGDILELYNCKVDIDVLSSTKLTGRRAMMALVTPMLQLLGQPPLQEALQAQGKKFDFVAFLNEVFDISGWPAADLVVPQTPQDQQAAMAQNPAIIKAQADQAKVAQGHQNDLELEQAKGETRSGVQVVKHLLDQSTPSEMAAQKLSVEKAQADQSATASAKPIALQ